MNSKIRVKQSKSRIDYRTTDLIDNFVDKDIQSMLFPFNLMQNMLFCPRYRIKDNFIYPNNFVSKSISLCVSILSIFLYCYQVYKLHINANIRYYLNISYIASYVDLFMYSIGFAMSYVFNVWQTKRNILLILRIQKVHRFLNEKPLFKRFIIYNWISVSVVFGSLIVRICCLLTNVNPSFTHCLNWISLFCFDLNYICAIRLIKLLGNKVDLWINQTQHLQRLQRMNTSEIETYCRKMFQAYVNILDCYKIYENSFQYTVWSIFSNK